MQYKRQQGIAHILALGLGLLVVAGIGGAGYMVYQRQQAKPATQATVQTTTTTTSQPATQSSTSKPVVMVSVYSKMPADVQAAIFTATKQYAPACIANNRIVDYDKAPYDQPVVYSSAGFIETGIGCDGGAGTLFVRQAGNWTVVSHTQAGYLCETYAKYHFPVDFVAAVTPTTDGKFATCLNAAGDTVTYTDTK